MFLLNPGPVNLSDRVRKALLNPDLCHREPEFGQLQQTIRDKLLQIYHLDPERWTAILLAGSGTSAMEATIASLVSREGKLLILENGVYGERISKIAQIYGIDCIALHHPWGAEIERSRLENILAEHQTITHLAVVHHETTTGRINDLGKLASLCRQYNLQMLVDGVSSFGAEELDFENWGIAACAATANKCLHGVPGMSFVIARRDILAKREGQPRTLYLDLLTYYQHQDRGNTPFTQPIQVMYALAEALQELQEEGGWQQRNQRYCDRMTLVRQGLIDLGIKPLLPEGVSSVVLNSFYLPEGLSYEEFHDRLKERGYIIYSGQGELAKSIFRVSTMGAIAIEDMKRFIAIVADIIA